MQDSDGTDEEIMVVSDYNVYLSLNADTRSLIRTPRTRRQMSHEMQRHPAPDRPFCAMKPGIRMSWWSAD